MGYERFLSTFHTAAQERQTSSSIHYPEAILPQSRQLYSFFDGLPQMVHEPADSMIGCRSEKIKKMPAATGGVATERHFLSILLMPLYLLSDIDGTTMAMAV
jgi:hypothetical protein